ncbi:MAG TPA: outer membrane protein assembly factor BamA [Allosphingosinicella sp.]
MTANKKNLQRRRLCSALLVGTILGGLTAPAYAQVQGPAAGGQPAPALPQVAPAPQAETQVIRSIAVSGNQRLEPETVVSYMKLRTGENYTRERLDEALRDLYATELFADVQILGGDTGNLVIQVRENPVINRIVLEGNKRLKDDKIGPEIRLAPRQIFTRTKARADVARIVELYRRQGRFAAQVEPKIVQLEQNRVDVVFEINEGPRSKIREINILGNEKFSDGDLRGEMVTKRTGLLSFLSSGAVYDPDRLAFDQQKLRQFYLTEGYADFRVVSAVAELTSDKQDFIITYVVEEGERYKFGDVKVESAIRDFKSEDMTRLLPMKTGDWYNAKQIEDTVTSLNESAGLFGYAFADIQPNFERNKEALTMGVTFEVAESPRVYVERIDINGNTITRDKVIRREFRVAEGDPFNSIAVKRSRDRIQSLGFFQEDLEVTQTQGSAPDRVVLGVDVEEKATGELQLSAGFSSLERILVNLSIRQRNFMGKGQELRASINYSSYSKSVELGFTEPYLFDRNIALGADLYRRDFSPFNRIGGQRETPYKQVSTGFQLRTGVPITEFLSLAGRYSLSQDEVELGPEYYIDPDGTGPLPRVCNTAGVGSRYYCESVGNRITSSIGYSLAYDSTDNRLRPTRGNRVVLNQDFAGLGGSVKYLRTRLNVAKYIRPLNSFVLQLSAEGGYIHSFEDAAGPNSDPVRIIDRFYLGEPQIRGFDIRGIGPRVERFSFTGSGPVDYTDRETRIGNDALGGRAYYLARAEVDLPLGDSVRELGLRPSIFVDAGAVFGLRNPATLNQQICTGKPAVDPTPTTPGSPAIPGATVDYGAACPTGTTPGGGFVERYSGDTPKPRISVGFGVNWTSPFGPFRIDIAKALTKAEGDDTKLISFNVGTAF